MRNIESHFLSAQECIMAGHIQNKLPNPCRFSPDGHFGSKAVTVCVTGEFVFFWKFNGFHWRYTEFPFFFGLKGDSKNQVHMEGYQVTYQCMALVRDGCLVPTKDIPEFGYVIESTDKQYVPDVYYKVRFFFTKYFIFMHFIFNPYKLRFYNYCLFSLKD